ncbi:MAG: hypothetical protein OXF89_18680 [Rhodospirillaceae bacterium]|nr:hypothetical protein [Rhodospirillaceae bacterium]MCY4066011.1 hypothetical protein [Rhodospirillaceae bacterium]
MSGIKSGSIEGDVWRQVKGRETGESGKSSNITTPYHTLGGERQVMAGIGHAVVHARIKSGAARSVFLAVDGHTAFAVHAGFLRRAGAAMRREYSYCPCRRG